LVHTACPSLTADPHPPQKFRLADGANPQDMQAAAPGLTGAAQFVQ